MNEFSRAHRHVCHTRRCANLRRYMKSACNKHARRFMRWAIKSTGDFEALVCETEPYYTNYDVC